MTKTDEQIKKLASAFSESVKDGDPEAKYESAKDVLMWLFDQPLLDRMTEQEREWAWRIYTLYYHRWADTQDNDNKHVLREIQSVMWILLGEEFFREQKQKMQYGRRVREL